MCRSTMNSGAGAAIERAMRAKIARVDLNIVGDLLKMFKSKYY